MSKIDKKYLELSCKSKMPQHQRERNRANKADSSKSNTSKTMSTERMEKATATT